MNLDNTNIDLNQSPKLKRCLSKTASVPGKPRGATYDGNICMICSDRASGFHYGVLACEGCKGFFKRVCKEKNKASTLCSSDSNDSSTNNSKDVLSQQNKRHCVFGGNCEINVRTRNRCQFCRIQKCIELGMSKDGIKLGRRSKKFKQNLNNVVSSTSTTLEHKQDTSSPQTDINNNLNSTELNNQQIFAILQDNKLIIKAIDILSAVSAAAASASTQTIKKENNAQQLSLVQVEQNNDQKQLFILSPTSSGSQDPSPTSINSDTNTPQPIIVLNSSSLFNSLVILNNTNTNSTTLSPVSQGRALNSVYSMFDKTQLVNIIENIVQAYKDTNSVYNQQSTIDINDENSVKSNISLGQMLEGGLVSILRDTGFLEHLNTLIENTVLFAKNVPYFMSIHESDRIALLKSSVFEVICVRHSGYFKYCQKYEFMSNDLVTLATCAVAGASVNQDMTCRFIIPFWDVWITGEWACEVLPEVSKFVKMLFEFYHFFNSMSLSEHEMALFSAFLLFNSDDPSLNDCEKLSNFKDLFYEILINELGRTRPVSGTREKLLTWLSGCFVKLKELNVEHARILNEHKNYVQFPDLYAELYNL